MEAFEDFQLACNSNHLSIMENMQLLHECRDSRDDHFSQRRSRIARNVGISLELQSGTRLHDDDSLEFGCTTDESQLLEHLEDIADCRSTSAAKHQERILEALSLVRDVGIYDCPPPHECESLKTSCQGCGTVEVTEEMLRDEHLWRKTYDQRRARLKEGNTTHPREETSTHSTAASQIEPTVSSITMSNLFSPCNRTTEPTISSLPGAEQTMSGDVRIQDLISEYGLNKEQERAFTIVAEHSMLQNADPLRMFITGPGGTGKSRVIKALKDWFDRRDQQRRFRLASFTGVAANNIDGMTLHSALSLGQISHLTKSSPLSRTRQTLVSMWQGVHYLFIDEVSMIGCKMLADISIALEMAKEKTTPFGGINIIFAGDFAQLPPVLQKRLYAPVSTQASTTEGEKTIFGKLLWLLVKTVVVLRKPMRQSGPTNKKFVDLLNRLRFGKCKRADYELLQTRIISNAKDDMSSSDWNIARKAPIIVYQNDLKDALNIEGAKAFARATGQELHWYYAYDTHGDQQIENPQMTEVLNSLHSGKTKQRLGKIPLVPGMPVTVTLNFDVEGGVVNGSRGTLKTIRYKIGKDGRRYATSCIVRLDGTSSEKLPGLNKNEAAVLAEEVSLKFKHPYSQKQMTIKRTQVPIQPAFAMTVHKSQGETMNRAIIDLNNCGSETEAAYVMASRVTSLDGLLILGDFGIQKIQKRQSQYSREEFERLRVLDLQTTLQYGDDDQRHDAACQLTEISPEWSRFRLTEDDINPESKRRAVQLNEFHAQLNPLMTNALSGISNCLKRRDVEDGQIPPPPKRSRR